MTTITFTDEELELIKFSAKAAYRTVFKFGEPDLDKEMIWNPRDDDGVSRRLAVNLRISISFDHHDGREYVVATPPDTNQGYDCLIDQDPCAATRFAVLRAAAEIGKAIP